MGKLCSTCIHQGSLINQGIYWCKENYDIDLDTCSKYEPLPATVTYSAAITTNDNTYWEK